MKKVLVIGLGKSGRACSSLLLEKGYEVFGSDEKNIRVKGVRFVKEKEILKILDKIDFAVISPGIDPRKKFIREIKKRKKIFSEIEVANWFIPKRSKVISITGTNGKTTTTKLIAEIFKKSGREAIACGNIGLPLSSVPIMKKIPDFIVVELSSFQLEAIEKYSSDVRILLNLSPDHTDRYRSFKEYYETKFKIFKNLRKSDYIVLNYYDRSIKKMDDIRCRKKFIIGEDIVLNENVISGKIRGKRFKIEVERDLTFLRANRENILSSVLTGIFFGVDEQVIKEIIEKFKVPPHRMELVRIVNGVKFINDSKSTNVSSVLNALRAVDRNVILILGGKDKMLNYKPVLNFLKKIKFLILYGEAGRRLKEIFKNRIQLLYREKLIDALNYLKPIAQKGDTVLFSPGCSSFDQFKNFIERGNFFKKWVRKL